MSIRSFARLLVREIPMYQQPKMFEVDIATSTACCNPIAVGELECANRGGVYLGAIPQSSDLQLPDCLTQGEAREIADGWADYARANLDCLLGYGSCNGTLTNVHITPW